MKRAFILAIVLVALIIGSSSYAVYYMLYNSAPSSSSTAPHTVKITDYTNANVTVHLPVQSIACFSSGLAEIICALGGEAKIIARLDSSVFPPSLMNVTSFGSSSRNINLESLLSLSPDLVIADTYFPDASRKAIEGAGVPVIMETTGDIPRLTAILTYLGEILNNTPKATQILDDIQYYNNLIQQRIEKANLTTNDKTTFYVELTDPWRCMANGSVQDALLVSCGGVNIAASNSSVTSPTLSAEVVAEASPDVIIKLHSGSTNLIDFQTKYNEIVSRPALQDTNAVKSGRVYVCYWYLTTGELYPVGKLYFAKWLWPSLFADINPSTIHAQLVQNYFGINLTGTWVYSGGDAVT